MSESGYRPSINEIKEHADESLRKSREKREEEKNRKLNLKQRATRVGVAAGLVVAATAGAAALAHEAGEASVKKDIGMEYAGEIDKNTELSLFPDESIDVIDNDGTQSIYHRLGYDDKGYTVAAFEAEVAKRNPGIVKPNGEFDIRPGTNALTVPKLPE